MEREIGFIKWFGGRNKQGELQNYGFIQDLSLKDVYVNRRRFLNGVEEESIEPDKIVFYNIKELKDGSIEAINVETIDQVDDLSLLRELCTCPDERFLRQAVQQYLPKASLEDAISLSLELLADSSKAFYRKAIIDSLPETAFIVSRDLRDRLDYSSHFRVLIEAIILAQRNEELLAKLIEELHDIDKLCHGLTVSDEVAYKLEGDTLRKMGYGMLSRLSVGALLNKIKDLKNGATEEDLQQYISILEDRIIEVMRENKTEICSIVLCLGNEELSVKMIDAIMSICYDFSPLLHCLAKEGRNLVIESLVKSLKKHSKSIRTRNYKFEPSLAEVTENPILSLISDGKHLLELFWQEIMIGDLSHWKLLNPEAKTLSIYRIVKQLPNWDKERLRSVSSDSFDKALVSLLDGNFSSYHRHITDYVVSRFENYESRIDLGALLPRCLFRETHYCEGKPWTNKEVAYCPRTARGCKQSLNGVKGARIKPIGSLDWEDWTLLEFFESQGIVPSVEKSVRPDEYVNKFSGWVNRLEEILERMKCSKCGQIMISNMKYSKNLARYNMTVASCPSNKENHDKNVYLNHCWACRNIIDSRESRYRVRTDPGRIEVLKPGEPGKGFYICIHCGSASQYDSLFTQSDVCPNCGERNMTVIPGSRLARCSNCDHTIYLPYESNITGPEYKKELLKMKVGKKSGLEIDNW